MEKRLLFNGMEMYVYNPKSETKASFEDINHFLKRFQISGSLNVICKIAHKINWENDGQGIIVNGVPITSFLLSYIAMKIIENGFDYKSNIITPDDIVKVIDMYYRIPEPIDDEESLHSCLIRFGSAEFDYQREMKNILPRTVLIYERLWEKCLKTTIKIKSEIERLFDLSIHEMALLAIAYYGRSQNGFITPYNENDIEIENQDLLQVLSEEKQLKFLYRFSATYSEFRSMLKEEKINDPLLEKFRFNPLLKKPIIIPDKTPLKDTKVFLVPIPKLMVEQVTRGLFFYLSDAFKGQGSSNTFRTEFGYVFQDYVGLILQKSLKKWEVLPEWVYDEKNSKKHLIGFWFQGIKLFLSK